MGRLPHLRRGEVLTTASLSPRHARQAQALLHRAFNGDFAVSDWNHCLGGWHALALEDGVAVAHGAVVPRTVEIDGWSWRCGYVEGVATEPSRQGHGLGSLVMQALARVIRSHFDFGALSTDAHGFYRRLGWQSWEGETYVRDDSGLVRTADEDAGVMVLRGAATAELALDGWIACHQRDGDDW